MFVVWVLAWAMACVLHAAPRPALEPGFDQVVRPFLKQYCNDCHDGVTRKAELDLERFRSVPEVLGEFATWDGVLDRLRAGDMPPAKSKTQPSSLERQAMVAWIEALREREARHQAGDPGPLPARRLNNAEYDHSIAELTGVDLRPTRNFPLDPANQAGFDNSAESLALSPALVKKYLEAAREVANHLVLQPEGFTFAAHPVIADTDRDKWAVFRIVDFYRRQPTDLADYLEAAWRFRYRTRLGLGNASLERIASDAKISPKYLARIWSALQHPGETVGPMAWVQAEWRALPEPGPRSTIGSTIEGGVRPACERLRSEVNALRSRLVPDVANLRAPPIHDGSQTLVLWKNRQMAANRRRWDPGALWSMDGQTHGTNLAAQIAVKTNTPAQAPRQKPGARVQAPTPNIVQRGGVSLAPTLVTRESSALTQMVAAKKRERLPQLEVPTDPVARAEYEAAFARFADLFPDAFYITERGRVYLDAEKEQENAGRLLSAGLHSMTGYFRDDQPLYDLVLNEAGQRELDRLWDQFWFLASVPHRMLTSLVWFERTDSAFLRDPEFDPFRPEDQSIHSTEKIRRLGELYEAKAARNKASDTARQAIRDHFADTARQITRLQLLHETAEPGHRAFLDGFAERAYRRPLRAPEREELQKFYQDSRKKNGLSHEEAMRDCVVRVLMSPQFSFRLDLVEGSGRTISGRRDASTAASVPLSDAALASRLSYFLWAGPPDTELLSQAATGELHRPRELRAQVRRMIQDPRIVYFAEAFAGHWLDFHRFQEHNGVDREHFSTFNNELRSAMYQEPLHFVVDVIQKDRSVLDLLEARDTFVNGPLARHYGIRPEPAGSDTWVHVANAREHGRGGLLPMAVFLTANSPGLRTSPVKRGYWVVRRVLGERIPPPPPTVPELPKDERSLGQLTLREALVAHRQQSGCAECHARFDSMGLVFEGYGPVGERRAMDLAGHPIDARAEFPGGSQGEGLDGLVSYLRQHRRDDFLDNLCRKLLAYGLGRTLILGDEPLIAEMKSHLAANHHHFGSLLESVVTSRQFLHKRLQTSPQDPVTRN